MPKAEHDTVVRRIAVYHKKRGEKVKADVKGYKKPPIFKGERGGTYRPDVYVANRKVAYEVEDYSSVMHQVSQIKAFYRELGGKRTIVVLCSGTTKGAKKRKRDLEEKGIRCRVINYRDLHYW
jgi:hypothetical protein